MIEDLTVLIEGIKFNDFTNAECKVESHEFDGEFEDIIEILIEGIYTKSEH